MGVKIVIVMEVGGWNGEVLFNVVYVCRGFAVREWLDGFVCITAHQSQDMVICTGVSELEVDVLRRLHVVVLSKYICFLILFRFKILCRGFFYTRKVPIHMSIGFFSCSVCCSLLYAFVFPGGAERS
jgi:hypothetical protein